MTRIASTSLVVFEVLMRCVFCQGEDLNAPLPFSAQNVSCRTGLWTTPMSGLPFLYNAIDTAKSGILRAKFLVPSIGSTIHVYVSFLVFVLDFLVGLRCDFEFGLICLGLLFPPSSPRNS